MKNQRKAKNQAPDELLESRQRVAELETELKEHRRAAETLREYQKVLEASQDMFAAVDQHYRYLLVNAKFLEYRGLDREQVVGRSVAEVLGKDVFEKEVKEKLDACFRGEAIQYEMKYVYPGLGEREVWVSYFPVENPDGISRVISTIRDITTYKRTEEALMASESGAKRLAQENASLARIGQIIGSTLAIEDVYERCAEEVRQLIPFDGISVCIINLSNRTFTIPYFASIDVEGRRAGDIIPLAGTATEKVLTSRSSLLIQSENWDEVLAQLPGLAPIYAAGCRSLVMVPLFSKDDVIGVLNFLSLKVGTYQERDLAMAERVGTQIAGAIANAQLYTECIRAEEALRGSEETARRLAQEVEIVATIGRIISSTLDIEEVYERFAQEVKKLFEFDRLSVNIIAVRENSVYMPYVWGTAVEGRQAGNVIPLIGSPTEAVFKTRSSLLIQAENEKEIADSFPVHLHNYHAGLRSALFIPLIVRDEVIGSLSIFSKKSNAYTDYDQKLAESVANQIAGAIANAQLFRDRKRSENKLLESEERFRRLVEISPLMILVHHGNKYVYANPAAAKALGASGPEELVGRSIFEVIHPDYWDIVKERVSLAAQGKALPPMEEKYIRLDKEIIEVEVTAVQGLSLEEPGVMLIARDITEQREIEKEKAALQERLQQAQKMEAIGTLAGGVAHDFNNILSAILGYAELAGMDIPENSRAKYNVQQSIEAAQRAKDLVQQILAFSRQGRQERKPLNIQPIIKEGIKFLRASLPATIEIRQNIEEDLGMIEADPTQVYQLMMNLCTNAAHAMDENGGILEVSLSQVDIPGGLPAASWEIEPGPYVRLRVSDTGHGMPPEILKRIFDPYFTTKEVGKGTGLGLAVVHGIVKSYGGEISVSSEVGKGSTFDIYFPRIQAMGRPLEAEKVEPLPFGGHERVLFVDDEKAIAEIGQKMLKYLGYEAEVRTSSIEALELFRVQADRFDLVITDMTMPNMTGDKLAQELLRIRPGIPIILCTGFSEYITEEKAKALGVQEFVMKPLVMKDLAAVIRRALDRKKKKQR